ncbi:MAG: IS1380 family transposase [Pseudomonadota bacterium]
MQTECNSQPILFQELGRREVIADFNGGNITSDAGGLLLQEAARGKDIIKRFSKCFTDYRNHRYTDHSLKELLAQRIFGIALGYEDLNDHDRLRCDPLLAALVGKADPLGENRKREEDKGKAMAGKSTLNRLELTPADANRASRYKKIVYHRERIERFLVEMFLDSYKQAPEKIILDTDATDDATHGNQEGCFFHGYYDQYCYLPLYIFCGDHLLGALLRSSNIDGAAGCLAELQRIIGQIRERWPETKIIVRGDSGFCREEIMLWCEQQEQVYYILGLAKNVRLKRYIKKAMRKAHNRFSRIKKASRFFRTFSYRTLKSWQHKRTVIGKAEYMEKGENPRFIVTNLPREYGTGQELYEKVYCARGDMENRIKEQQLWLFADRTSTELMRSNQLRLWFSSVAYVLIAELRRIGLKGTEMEKAQVGTIRTKLFKIGALVKVSVRRVLITMSSAYPYAGLFNQIVRNIRLHYPLLT